MNRLIYADVLLEELIESCKWHAENSRELSLLQRDINIVNEQPTVDAEPVRHGRWIYHIDDLFPSESTQECSVCHENEYITLCHENYCPHCGARMDEE